MITPRKRKYLKDLFNFSSLRYNYLLMKRILLFLTFILCLFIFPSEVEASLVTVNKDGEIVWNVLAYEKDISLQIPTRDSLKVDTLTPAPNPSPEATISLKKEGEKVELQVSSNEGDKKVDVTSFQENIVEIEERPEAQKVQIALVNGDFLISQKGISARTTFPIFINAKKKELSVQTSSGLRYLTILPFEAVENVVKANLLSRLEPQGEITLSENTQGELAYEIAGKKIIKPLDLFEFSIPIKASISASNGQILNKEGPLWFKIFGFLIT